MKVNNKIRLSIRATAAVAALGMASQANALTLNVNEDIEVSLYGYARLNMSYDFDDKRAVPTRSGSFSPSANEDAKGHFGADVRQSRLGIKVKHASGVELTVEGDFNGSGNSAGSLRMRHAYGEYKGFMVGRNWSNFTSFVGMTPTLDFDHLAGTAGSQDRTEQLRYTIGPVSFSIENPSVQDIIGTTDTRTSAPAITTRFENSAGLLSYSAAALLSQVTADDGNQDDSAFGYAAFGALKLQLSDMFSVQGNLNFTDGASGYLWRSGDNYFGASAYLDGSDVETIKGYGGTLGMSMDLGNGRSINLGYGTTKLDLDDAVSKGAATSAYAEINQNVLLNYMWTPVENVMMGVEYGYFDQETQGGDSTDANRVILATQYNF